MGNNYENAGASKKPRGSILKMVNYQEASMEKMFDRIRYISNPKKSPECFQKGVWLSHQNAAHGFEVIYKRHKPKGSRNFKQGIISYGVKEIEPQVAFQAGVDIASYFEGYPLLLCVHTDLPHHVHAHFILGTVHIATGNKFSQSPDDFQKFREYTNGVLQRYDLPILKGTEISEDEKPDYQEEVKPETQTRIVRAALLEGPSDDVEAYYPSYSAYPRLHTTELYGNCRCDLSQLSQDIIRGMEYLRHIIQHRGNKNV